MTDGTNPIQPGSENPKPEDNEGKQPGPDAQVVQPDTASEDPDEVALREAVAAVEAEEAAAKAKTEGEQEQPGEGQQQQPPAQGQEPKGQQPEPVMIPKARLDEVISNQRKAEQDAAFWRGIAEGRSQQQPGQPAQQQPQTQATPEQRITELDNQITALAVKFDDGTITMSEFKQQERELQRQQEAIREESRQAPRQPAQKPQANDDLYLEAKTAELEGKHPWITVFEKVGTDAHWGLLKQEAIENLAHRGIDPTAGNWGKLQLRTEIARLADHYGPSLVAERAKAQGIALPGQSQPPKQQQAPADARRSKLQLQEQAPPDVTAMRGGGTDQTAVSEADIARMSEDELDALPRATRQKLLGITSA